MIVSLTLGKVIIGKLRKLSPEVMAGDLSYSKATLSRHEENDLREPKLNFIKKVFDYF